MDPQAPFIPAVLPRDAPAKLWPPPVLLPAALPITCKGRRRCLTCSFPVPQRNALSVQQTWLSVEQTGQSPASLFKIRLGTSQQLYYTTLPDSSFYSKPLFTKTNEKLKQQNPSLLPAFFIASKTVPVTVEDKWDYFKAAGINYEYKCYRTSFFTLPLLTCGQGSKMCAGRWTG